MNDRYGTDVLSTDWRAPKRGRATEAPATLGEVVEEVTADFCGEIVAVDRDLDVLTLEDRRGRRRTFPLGPGFLLDGKPVILTAPVTQKGPAKPTRTASGSVAVETKARVARASRIFVEGRHDAELVEKVWGDDLRVEGVAVEYLGGVDDLADHLRDFRPGPGRRVGVLVDHLVAGSKESRIAQGIARSPVGKHVLIVFDDLSKQAEAYRAVSLLLRRPPGREAYPGDVFYLHSRLLERCAKLSDDLGAGSMTGLPIIETKANDVSAFIPTNVISITDGQIFLQSDLFASNQRPAIDVGVSVSRVGGAAMTKAMKAVTGSLKVDLAQFRAMEAFAMFASDLDAASRQQLDRGQRLMALLKQPAYSPYPLEEMTVSLWLGTTGRLDRVPVEDVIRFEHEFIDFLKRSHEGILAGIRETTKFEDEDALAAAYDSFTDQFETSEGGSIKAGREEAEAMEDDELGQEQIVKQKRG